MPDNEEIKREILEKLLVFKKDGKLSVKSMSLYPQGLAKDHIHAIDYLAGKGLITAAPLKDVSVRGPAFKDMKITAAGEDFLTGVEPYLVVKMHPETLKALQDIILAAVDQSDASGNEKTALKRAIESLPAATTGALVQELLSFALSAGGAILPLLHKYGVTP